jgi:hypothetical protein
MREWMRPAVFLFDVLAAIGLALSFVSHGATFFGSRGPLGDHAMLLHMGIFVVWVPTVLISRPLTSEYKRRDFWQAALRGCPPWMKYMVGGFFAYAILNFIIFFVAAPRETGPNLIPVSVVRGFSGHWMAFYSAALAVLYSAGHVSYRDKAGRCLNGHAVGPLAQFCEQCGQPVAELPSDRSI